jgi:hypothetical protein
MEKVEGGWSRICPQRKENVLHIGKHARQNCQRTERDGRLCKNCAYKNRRHTNLTRNCPVCKKEIKYKDASNRNNAEKLQKKCIPCSKRKHIYNTTIRNCPVCKKVLNYSSGQACFRAGQSNSKCRTCMQDKGELTKKLTRVCPKCQQIVAHTNRKACRLAVLHNKTCPNCQKKNQFGKDNPSYKHGKIPHGGSRGWCGHYNNIFFRSRKELFYIIHYLEKFEQSWVSGEQKKYRIDYIYNNQEFTYYPDFIVNDEWMIEIKPFKQHNDARILAKSRYAKDFCLEHGLKYAIFDCPSIGHNEFYRMADSRLIQPTHKNIY